MNIIVNEKYWYIKIAFIKKNRTRIAKNCCKYKWSNCLDCKFSKINQLSLKFIKPILNTDAKLK